MLTQPRRASLPLTVAGIAIILLAGCTPDGVEPTPTSGASETSSPGATASPTPTADPIGTPIDASCSELVTPEALYVYNPNYGSIDDFTPAPGSAAASAEDYRGVACRWQNQTSGDTIDVSVAHLDDATLTALKNAAFESSEMVPTYGEEAYFTVDNGVGTAIVFDGPFWIVAESRAFFEPGDATELIESVLAALPA